MLAVPRTFRVSLEAPAVVGNRSDPGRCKVCSSGGSWDTAADVSKKYKIRYSGNSTSLDCNFVAPCSLRRKACITATGCGRLQEATYLGGDFRKRRFYLHCKQNKSYGRICWWRPDLKRRNLLRPMEQFKELSPTALMGHSPGSGSTSISSFIDKLRKNALLGFFKGTSKTFQADELGMEIAVIAVPALLALAADPLASLVDTAFIGQIGPVELAAVGVSISIFNLISKMFNIPLLNITTSFVAEDDASAKDGQLDSVVQEPIIDHAVPWVSEEEELLQPMEPYIPKTTKPLLPAVSSALVLGTGLGLMEAAVLTLGAGPILTVMGVGVGSSMRVPAVQYLALRAVGAPAVVVSLAVQGVFRGFKDTKTPLVATVLGNFVNILLDPILMFSLNFGVSGAAIATVLSQYVIALVLLWTLNSRVVLLPPKLSDLRLDRFLKSGGLLLGRTVAILLTMTLATSMAARQGAIPMAAHQICMQVWLAASLLSDSLALAGQAIIASAYAKRDYRRVKETSFRILQMGLAFGLFMAAVLGLGAGWFTKLFTNDLGVLAMIPLILPFVVLTQPINSLAFVFDGIYYGISDFGYAAYSMISLALPSSFALLVLPPYLGLSGVWIGLTVLMTLRMLAGFFRVGSSTGAWEVINADEEERLLGDDFEENNTTL